MNDKNKKNDGKQNLPSISLKKEVRDKMVGDQLPETIRPSSNREGEPTTLP